MSAENATSVDFKKQEQEAAKRRLTLQIEDFCSRWAPNRSYGYDNHARFYAELHQIIMLSVIEAQQPLIDALMDIRKAIAPPMVMT